MEHEQAGGRTREGGVWTIDRAGRTGMCISDVRREHNSSGSDSGKKAEGKCLSYGLRRRGTIKMKKAIGSRYKEARIYMGAQNTSIGSRGEREVGRGS